MALLQRWQGMVGKGTFQVDRRSRRYAGANHNIFSDSALDEIFKFSSGAARLVNKVCTHCLLYGAQNNRSIIDDHMVKWLLREN